MGKKNKKKKVNPKKERCAKFRKEHSSTMAFTTPDITPEQQKQRQEDERNIGLFWRYNKRRHVPKGIRCKEQKIEIY